MDKRGADAVCGAYEVSLEEINKLSSVKYKRDGVKNQIETVVEKPKPEEAPSLMMIFGRFVLRSSIIESLKKTQIDRGELWLTNAINGLATDGGIVVAEPLVEGKWMTTGDPLNLMKISIELGLRDERYREELLKLCRSVDE